MRVSIRKTETLITKDGKEIASGSSVSIAISGSGWFPGDLPIKQLHDIAASHLGALMQHISEVSEQAHRA